MNHPWGLHWFRRDLRVAGNPALRYNWKKNQGKVLGFFCFDPTFLSREDFSNDRFSFFIKTMEALKEELQELGGDLLVLEGKPEEALPELFRYLSEAKINLPQTLTFNRDYEPFARKRDEGVINLIRSKTSIEVHTERDHLLFEPGEILKDSKDPKSFYSVYTPFAKKWFENFKGDEAQRRIHEQVEGIKYLKKRAKGETVDPLFNLNWHKLFGKNKQPVDKLNEFKKAVEEKTRIQIPKAGSLEAFKHLEAFQSKLNSYLEKRDIPSLPGTSKLSLFYKNGSLTGTQTIAAFKLKMDSFGDKTGPNQFFKELVWREFYYHILWHRPNVENESFLPVYRDLEWENDKKKFEAWKKGETGFPIVDAGMRELNQTGWMHNRVRMIVASFLTKDLLIDWRWGERYFMERLLDGDLAPNNGGWQWAASTGCDPQPYFRIFNPQLQSEKFDPEGHYIRKYVPELSHLSNKEIHAPISMVTNYPKPIVNHSSQRVKAIALFKETKGSYEKE
jgi:deoxyribodipyrimidine photo-lyase